MLEVEPAALDELRALLDEPITVLGTVTTDRVVRIAGIAPVAVDDLVAAFNATDAGAAA